MNRRQACEYIGNKAQDLFESNFRMAKKSDRETDMYDHIDYFINGVGIDVKYNAHLDTIWLELKNVRGDKGWLQGKAEYICWYIEEHHLFVFFKRTELLDFVQSNVTDYTTDKREYMKYYSRIGRDDLITKVKMSHIRHLLCLWSKCA